MKLFYFVLLCTLLSQLYGAELATQPGLPSTEIDEQPQTDNITVRDEPSRVLEYLNTEELQKQIIDLDERYAPAKAFRLRHHEV